MTAVLSPRDRLAAEIQRQWPPDRRPLGEVFGAHDAILRRADSYAGVAGPALAVSEVKSAEALAEEVRAACAARYGDDPQVTAERRIALDGDFRGRNER